MKQSQLSQQSQQEQSSSTSKVTPPLGNDSIQKQMNIAENELIKSTDDVMLGSPVEDDEVKMVNKTNNDRTHRVSFPKHDCNLVTGYLEPANPWASVKVVSSPNELTLLYRESCTKHLTEPIDLILEHLKNIDTKSGERLPILNLREQQLTADACEALEEILKRVQYRCIDVSQCGLDDMSASALFDMIEYYEATNELDISENRNISNLGWQSCISMVKKSHALQILSVRATALTDNNASSLGKAMLLSSLHTLKLEHCGLTGRPISSLCTNLKRNTVLKELWLAHNDLTQHDAYTIGLLLKSNYYIQFLDISNNYIGDLGVGYIVDAVIEQANKLNDINNSTAPTSASQLSLSPLSVSPVSSTNNNNSNNNNIIETSLSSTNEVEDLKKDNLLNKNETDVTGKLNGRSKLDVLLTNLNEPNKTATVTNATESDNLNIETINESDDKLVQKTNTELLTTIYEDPINNNNTNNNNTNNNIEHVDNLVQENLDNKEIVKLYTVAEEEFDEKENDKIIENVELELNKILHSLDIDENNTLSHENNNECLVLDVLNEKITDVETEITQRPKEEETENVVAVLEQHEPNISEVEEVKPLTTTLDDNIIELKIVEDSDNDDAKVAVNEDYDLIVNIENNNSSPSSDESSSTAKINMIYEDVLDKQCSTEEFSEDNTSTEEKSVNNEGCDLLEKSTESFEFIDPSTIEIITSSPSPTLISAPISMRNSNTNNNDDNVGLLSQSFDETILLKSTLDDKNCDLNLINKKTVDDSNISSSTTSVINLPPPERSLSSDSINSDTSIDSNDSKSSIKLTEMKFNKNGTLERQQQNIDKMLQENANILQPTGIQVLVFWNNQITRHSSKTFSDLISKTNSLEILNVGRNVLSNEFVSNIKTSLKQNTTLTNLGLQGAHLSCAGIKSLSEILEFGGNSSLQRIDLRDNNIDTQGLTALDEAMKTNKTVTRIDLDETPRKILESNGNSHSDYTRLVTSIRSQCTRNENPPQEPELIPRPNVKKVRSAFRSSRKISLTCQSIRPTSNNELFDRNLLDPNNKIAPFNSNNNNNNSHSGTIKTIGRLKSPLPSPNPSPMSSPTPSPSRNRFHVSKVLENITPSPSSSSLISTSSSTNSSPSSYSFNNSRFRVTTVDTKKDSKNSLTHGNSTTDKKSSTEIKTTSPASVSSKINSNICSNSNNYHNEIINFTFNFDDNPSTLTKNNIMDDSCSSLSSMDSIDRPLNNTSSSNDDSSSIDNLISPKFFSSSLINDSLSSLEDNLIDNIKTDNLVINPISNMKLSDDDNDTLTNPLLIPNVTNTPPTLTTTVNSNVSNLDKNQSKSSTSSSNNINNHNNSSNNSGNGRVRKTSFFSTKGGVMGTGGGGSSNTDQEPAYPQTLEKLLSLFRSSSSSDHKNDSNNKKNESSNTTTSATTTFVQTATVSVAPVRKESPMGGLLAWMTNQSNKKSTDESPSHQPVSANPIKSNSPVTLRHKLSDNVICSDLPSSKIASSSCPNYENTSINELSQTEPDNDIPTTIEATIDSEPIERVHFEVGGDDDEDDVDEESAVIEDSTSTITTITSTVICDTSRASDQSIASLFSQNELSLNSKLGQIARDSLAMFKGGGGSKDSQDSITFENDSKSNVSHQSPTSSTSSPSHNLSQTSDTPPLATSPGTTPYHELNVQSFTHNNL